GDGPGATALRPCGPDVMVNMSVWENLESLRDFVYRSGPHLDFMRRRRAWFHPMAVPYLVLWWVPAGHIPGLDEALSRLDLLRPPSLPPRPPPPPPRSPQTPPPPPPARAPRPPPAGGAPPPPPAGGPPAAAPPGPARR